jgi:ElaB/YqjD/DUF883 family membrane-anchored ribosome-binding protein
MKKLLAFLLVVGFSLTFVACGNQAKEDTTAEEVVEEAADDAEEVVEEAAEEAEEMVEEVEEAAEEAADSTEVSE